MEFMQQRVNTNFYKFYYGVCLSNAPRNTVWLTVALSDGVAVVRVARVSLTLSEYTI